MATEEHKKLAAIVKQTHDRLRRLSKEKGHDVAWKEHVNNTNMLEGYAQAMHSLANIWEKNSQKDEDALAKSRISWITANISEYFYKICTYKMKRERELRLMQSWEDFKGAVSCRYLEEVPKKLKILDVGSCFNPFAKVPDFDVTAFDLCPATKSVLRGDLLTINITEQDSDVVVENGTVTALPKSNFHCVIFSLLLEYIPSSQMRLICCQKAYDLLKPEGILVIITPDSQHVGKNANLMKNWHFTMSKIGFLRVKFEKLPHITCMIFRKSINISIPQRWADEHWKNENVTFGLDIPQDKNY